MAAAVLAGKETEDSAELRRKLEAAETRARRAEQAAAEHESAAKAARSAARDAAREQKRSWLDGVAPSRVGMFGRR